MKSSQVASMVWLEAEQFENTGGWINDSQFINQMGSPYLLAIGLGNPVEDAVTSVVLPKAGRYRLWVRCRDWMPEHNPGRFQVILNGNSVGHIFGKSKKEGWIWEDGGTHKFNGEEVEVRLRDLTGYYGRCDVVVLTDDLFFHPPDDKTELAVMRKQYGGVSREEKRLKQYDVVVVGGGLAGCLAAVSAARLGCRTALIQNRPVLGGNASTECLVPPVGVRPYGEQEPLDPRETGIIEEVRTRGNQTDEEAKVYSDRLVNLCQGESKIDLYLNTHATGVEMEDTDMIGAVKTVHVKNGERWVFPASIVIDCTGDGDIGIEAGASFRHGREQKAMYNESLAPEEGDSYTMGCGLKYISKERSHPVTFKAPPWAIKFHNCSDFQPTNHPPLNLDRLEWQWRIEIGGRRDTIADAEEIRDKILRVIYGIWDHIKNHCPKLKEKAVNRELVWVSHILAKRESRRIIGDYVMTEHDIINSTLFPDRVAYSSWGIDLHDPAGFYYKGKKTSKGKRVNGVEHALARGQKYSIPFRSLYSKDIKNLMMAGRNISVSHVALGSVRVMLTCALMGEALGTAAWLCKKYNTTPRGVYKKHNTELQQQLLKDGCYLIDLPNNDPHDLARAASVTASSSITNMGPEHVIDGFGRAEHGEPHSWQPDTSQTPPYWVELDFSKPVPFNRVHVSFQTKEHAADSFRIEVWANNQWQTVAHVADKKQRRHVIHFDRKISPELRLVLTKAPDTTAVCEIRVYDEPVK